VRNFVEIKLMQVTKTADGAGGFTLGVEETLYETRAVVKQTATSRSADALASEVNYGVKFDLFLPPCLVIGTEVFVYVGRVRHDIVGVTQSDYPPIKHTITTVRRDN